MVDQSIQNDRKVQNWLYQAVLIFLLAFLIRVLCVVSNPVLYGEETFQKLSSEPELLNDKNLPLFSLILYFFRSFSFSLPALRIFLSLIGGLLSLSIYLFLLSQLDQRNAFLISTLIALNPLGVKWSIVPYHYTLLMLFFVFGLMLLAKEKFYWRISGLILLNLASATGYEIWLFCLYLCIYQIKVFYKNCASKSLLNYQSIAYPIGYLIFPLLWSILFFKKLFYSDGVLWKSISCSVLKNLKEIILLNAEQLSLIVLLFAFFGLFYLRDFSFKDRGVKNLLISFFIIDLLQMICLPISPDFEARLFYFSHFVLILAGMGSMKAIDNLSIIVKRPENQMGIKNSLFLIAGIFMTLFLIKNLANVKMIRNSPYRDHYLISYILTHRLASDDKAVLFLHRKDCLPIFAHSSPKIQKQIFTSLKFRGKPQTAEALIHNLPYETRYVVLKKGDFPDRAYWEILKSIFTLNKIIELQDFVVYSLVEDVATFKRGEILKQ